MDNSARGFSKVERANISKQFREMLQVHGVDNAVLSLIESSSEKAPIRRRVLFQQCRKQEFKNKFKLACKRLIKSYPALAVKIIQLRDEVAG